MSHDSGDCSQRVCPYDFAWVDKPDASGIHHKYMECSAKGICNRDSGECECFPGYEGKSCQRTTCPNDCSGHGLCRYIEQMPFQSAPNDFKQGIFGETKAVTFESTFSYWDEEKTRGCVCDPTWGDYDCSKRMCPYATDVMDIREDMTKVAKYQTQRITLVVDWIKNSQPVTNDGHVMQRTDFVGRTFALTFTSRLNETFTTIPISISAGHTGFHDFVLDVEAALEALPNFVVDDVEVQGDFLSINGLSVGGNGDSYNQINLNVTFVGDAVQGPQHLLVVNEAACGDGCTPKITGLNVVPMSNNVTEVSLSDFNSFECGRRGKCDYATGICQCFAGYTGQACNTITSLI